MTDPTVRSGGDEGMFLTRYHRIGQISAKIIKGPNNEASCQEHERCAKPSKRYWHWNRTPAHFLGVDQVRNETDGRRQGDQAERNQNEPAFLASVELFAGMRLEPEVKTSRDEQDHTGKKHPPERVIVADLGSEQHEIL